MNINEWPKEAKEVFIKILNEQGFHKVASMLGFCEDLQQLVEMAKDERTVKDELIKEVMSAVTEEHLKLFDEYNKMKAEEEAARHETIMINREIAELQLDKVNEEAVKQTEQKVEPQQPSAIIIDEELEQCFKSNFRGIGGNHINYYKNSLLPRLKIQRSNKEYARIALLIYESGKLSNKPTKFSTWYKRFCELIKCNYNKGYNPASLKDQYFDKLKEEFNVLNV